MGIVRSKEIQLAWGLCLAALLGAFPSGARAQRVALGRSFTGQGALIEPGSEFVYVPSEQKLAVKYLSAAGRPVSADTLYVIVKNLDGIVGRYYMKRSKSRLEGNTLMRVPAEGIYRVFVYHPRLRTQPLASTTVFITGTAHPTRRALIAAQREVLVERGLLAPAPAAIASAQPAATSSGPSSPAGSVEAEDDPDYDPDSDLEDDEEPEDLDAPSTEEPDLDEDDEEDDDADALDLPEIAEPTRAARPGAKPGSELDGPFESYDDLDEGEDFEIEDFN